MKRTANRLTELGENISTAFCVNALLKALPENKFKMIKELIRQKQGTLKYQDVVSTVHSYIRNATMSHGTENKQQQEEFKNKNGADNQLQPKTQKQPEKMMRIHENYHHRHKQQRRCYSCRKYGHYAAKCPDEKDDTEHNQRRCYRCRKYGHLAADCTEQTKRQAQFLDRRRQKWKRQRQRTIYHPSEHVNKMQDEIAGLKSKVAVLENEKEKQQRDEAELF